MPINGTNKIFDNIPINREIAAQRSVIFSLPLIIRISADAPKREFSNGESKISKKVDLEIKKSTPKNKIINFS